MKKPIIIMIITVAIILVVAGGGVGAYLYLKHRSKTGSTPHRLSASQAAALQTTLPQMTTNLKSSGLIQFTLTLQSNNKGTKAEVEKMRSQIEDKVNETMRHFTPSDLKSAQGLSKLKNTVLASVNSMLQTGKITNVYFAQVLVE